MPKIAYARAPSWSLEHAAGRPSIAPFVPRLQGIAVFGSSRSGKIALHNQSLVDER
jgi:hypothetical protein